MVMLLKWNFQKKEYERVNILHDARASVSAGDMFECANCGCKITYEDCYVSKQWHTDMGLGYHVCEVCKAAELKLQREYPDD